TPDSPSQPAVPRLTPPNERRNPLTRRTELSTRPHHIIVLGGGALGISTAAHLIHKGVDVTVLTEAELASGASGRSLSWLNSAGERSPEYHEFRMAGIDRYRDLKTRHPQIEWLDFGGGVFWGTGPEVAEA